MAILLRYILPVLDDGIQDVLEYLIHVLKIDLVLTPLVVGL